MPLHTLLHNCSTLTASETHSLCPFPRRRCRQSSTLVNFRVNCCHRIANLRSFLGPLFKRPCSLDRAITCNPKFCLYLICCRRSLDTVAVTQKFRGLMSWDSL